jgi:hypothetical protein
MSVTIDGSGTITGISAGGLPDGSITNDDLAGSITDAKLSGTTCKAFVNFDGTGTPAIRAQFNVSSITDNGTGDYTVNFTTAMADANYSPVFGMSASSTSSNMFSPYFGKDTATTSAPTSSGFRIFTRNSSNALNDVEFLSAAIFR